MATQQNMILKVSADTTEVTKGIENVEDSVKGTDAAVGGLTNQLDKMTGGAVTGFRNFTKGVKTGVLGLKSFKVALAATGIGLLLVAFAALASYFTSTKKGAEQLKVATAALGAIFDVLRDRVSKMGEALFEAISNPKETIIAIGKLIKENLINRFEGLLEFIPAVGKAISLALKGEFLEAGKVAADAAGKMVLGVESVTDVVEKAGEAVKGLTEEITKEAQAAADLEAAMNALKDEERDFIKVRAETNKQIAEARLLAEDETLTVEQRLVALQRAVDLEKETVAQQLALAEERARIAREQVALGESLEEDFQRVAEAEAAVIDLQTASLRTQKRLGTELNSLKLESINLQREQLKNELDLAKATVKSMEARRGEEIKTLEVTQEVATATLQTNQTSLTSQVDLTETAEEEKRRLRRETFEDFKNGAELSANAALDIAETSLSVLGDLNEAFGYKSVERQNKIDDLLLQASETKDQSEKESLEKKAKALGKIQDREGKKQFERGKVLSIAQALISTYESATAAFNSLANIPVVGVGLGIAAAGAAVVAGLANVKKIKSQTYKSQGTGGGSSYSSSGSSGSGQQAATSPQLDLSFLGGGAGQDGFRTYVIASEVSNSQQANQKINDQAALVG